MNIRFSGFISCSGLTGNFVAVALKMDRGTFFHAVYRIQQKLGRVFREVEPYALFPLDEYFGGTARTSATMGLRRDNVITMPPPAHDLNKNGILRPPLKKVA